MKARHWLHEGAFYGADGRYVGSYYNNDSGWFTRLVGGKTIEAKSRRDAMRLLEAADAEGVGGADPRACRTCNGKTPEFCSACSGTGRTSAAEGIPPGGTTP